MCQAVSIEVSPGELIDKLTILEIKLDRISDVDKRHNVSVERDLLAAAFERLDVGPDIAELVGALREVNESLWTIEDEIRDCERRGDFGAAFVAHARSVYVTNDRRAELKRAVNLALGSRLMEEKSYRRYA